LFIFAFKDALNAGVPDQSWLVGSGHFMPEWDTTSERVRFRLMPKREGASDESAAGAASLLGLRRRRGKSIFEL
jgi:hypothetical protein